MIIGAKTGSSLTREHILEKITEYDIYRYYVGRGFRLNRQIQSPLRRDEHPSFLISNKYGYLYHIDFAEASHRGDCFDLVRQLFGCDLWGALNIINKDFGLGLVEGTNTGEYKRITSAYKQPSPEESTRYCRIQVLPKPFTQKELDYWGQYYQGLEDLKREDIFSVKKVFLDKSEYKLIGGNEMVFGYLYDNEHWKIYRPLEEKGKKWMSSVPIVRVDGLENITPGCENAIVTKSKKDKMVLLKIMDCVCSVQNESKVALSEETVNTLKTNSKRVYINYDADAPGKKNSWIVTKEFGFLHVNVPDNHVINGIKDFSDMAKIYGLETVVKYFKSKNIL
jgi:hypothetical protein